MDSLSDQEAIQVLYDWEFWQREAQQEPLRDWLFWYIITGRGWGKTRVGAETTNKYAKKGVKRLGFIGPTVADCRDVMIEGESGILECSPPWFKPKYIPSRRRLEYPNGSVAFTYSAEDPDQLRGPQHGFIWGDEPAAWKYPDETYSNAMFGLRQEPSKAVFTTTPRPIKLIRQFVDDSDAQSVLTTGTTYENMGNLSAAYRKIVAQYEGTRLGQQELMGILLRDVPGALWKFTTIDETRVARNEIPGSLNRVVVSIDPAVSNTENSDETGIIVSGKAVCECKGHPEMHGFVFDDLTLKASPNEWALRAINALREWSGDRIIAEINNGGDMVENTVRMVDSNIPFRAVRASRGKIVRAEPVAALYEQHKIHHVGNFATLEDQMCTYTADTKESPDRMDALVWGLTDLFVALPEPTRKTLVYHDPVKIGPDLF